MNNAERKNLKQGLKIDIDSADSYMRFALAGFECEKKKPQTKGSEEWIVDSLKALKKQIKDKGEKFLKEIDDTIEKLS